MITVTAHSLKNRNLLTFLNRMKIKFYCVQFVESR